MISTVFNTYHPIVKGAYFLAALLLAMTFFATVLTVLFQRSIYRKWFLPRYDRSFTPRCTIVLPVKGIPKDLDKNLLAYDKLDYPDFQVLVTVESESDPAVAVARPIIDRSPHMSLIVAGLTKSCSQKNHNMIAAVAKAANPDVYVFADADIGPTGKWLRELITPLSDPSITATTGFRWCISHKAAIGELTHTNVNAFFLALFGLVTVLRLGSICWGGSMAMRKKDFDDLKVTEKWGRSGVDDIALAQVLAKNRRRSILVPTCITLTDDLIQTSSGTINWCARQIMFLKAYHRPLWAFGLGALWLMAAVLHLLLPAAIIGALATGRGFFELGGGAPLLYMIGDMLIVLLYPLMGPVPKFHRLLLLQPFYRITHLVSYAKTMFSRTILWSGIRYTLNFSGDVIKVERLS